MDNKWLLCLAAETGNTETVRNLLDDGTPLDTKGIKGRSLLHFAAWGGHVPTLRLLIRRGCNVDTVDNVGFTPLQLATAMGQTKTIRELIRSGAALSVVPGGRGTPLLIAAYNGRAESAAAILEEGCPIEEVKKNTVLHIAAGCGHINVVRELVSRGCDENAVDDDGCTPLHHAASRGKTKAVCELILRGACKSVVAGEFGTPLHQAALNGHLKTVVAMLELGCPCDAVNSSKATVLHLAAKRGHVEVVSELAVRKCNVNALDVNGCTPLHYAAGKGETEAVHELVKHGAIKSVVSPNYGTPLHQAVAWDHTKTFATMLEAGFPIDVVDREGATVLHIAADRSCLATVMELLARGCDVNAVDKYGQTPLHCAAAKGKTEATRELMKHGAHKSVVAGEFGTPLHQAVLKGHVDTVAAMLDEGCPINEMDSNGVTVLHWAAKCNHAEVVRKLVERGCDVNAEKATINGCTPLHYAAVRGAKDAVHELVKRGATKSVVAGLHGTPLHQAVIHGKMEIVQALLEDEPPTAVVTSSNATPSNAHRLECSIVSACDPFGQTPLMWAVSQGDAEVFKLLISKGGAISDRDAHSLSTLEHCFVAGHSGKLRQFCEACGIRSTGEGLKGALAALITQDLAEACKVLCLCAMPGDGVFLDDQFSNLVASDACAMHAAVKFAKYYFDEGEGISFINKLSLVDENALNPLQMSLLSMKCFEMGFATDSVKHGIRNHSLFITKLLAHPVLKDRVNENFPNGLSPLDLAQQFGLHSIIALIEEAGGRPGVWAGMPQEIETKHPIALPRVKEAYSSFKAIAEGGESGREFMKVVVSSILRLPTAEREVQTDDNSWQIKEEDGLRDRNAAIIGADVGPETDEHEYKSLMVPADKSKKPPPMRPCKTVSEVLKKVEDHSIEINAMLNHHTGGTVHFGIQDTDNTVEEGLDLSLAVVLGKLQSRVGQLLQGFYPVVQSRFVKIQPVHLLNSSREPTGRWRFDIYVTPCDDIILLSRTHTVAYYRQGANSEPMPAEMLVKGIIQAFQVCMHELGVMLSGVTNVTLFYYACVCAASSSSQMTTVGFPFESLASSAQDVGDGAIAAERNPSIRKGELCGVSCILVKPNDILI